MTDFFVCFFTTEMFIEAPRCRQHDGLSETLYSPGDRFSSAAKGKVAGI